VQDTKQNTVDFHTIIEMYTIALFTFQMITLNLKQELSAIDQKLVHPKSRTDHDIEDIAMK
jgi:hypothetical protein